jgi:hypothetical protein
MAPTGRPVVLPWVIITEFDGHLVAKDWEMFDASSLVRQLDRGRLGGLRRRRPGAAAAV